MWPQSRFKFVRYQWFLVVLCWPNHVIQNDRCDIVKTYVPPSATIQIFSLVFIQSLSTTTPPPLTHADTHQRCTSLIARFMGPTWGPSGANGTQVGPVLAPWTLISGIAFIRKVKHDKTLTLFKRHRQNDSYLEIWGIMKLPPNNRWYWFPFLPQMAMTLHNCPTTWALRANSPFVDSVAFCWQ